MDGAALLAALGRERAEREALAQRVDLLEAKLGALTGTGVAPHTEGGGAPPVCSRASEEEESEDSSDRDGGDSNEEEEWQMLGPDKRISDGKYVPSVGNELTENDLDLTSVYEIHGSVWDCCLFAGLDCMGRGRSLVLVLVTLLAAGTQVFFCQCVISNMIDDPVSGDTLNALLYFRTSIMHDVRYADVAQGRSLAAQVCAGDDGYQMQWAGSQVSIMGSITKGLKSGKRLVMLALFLWSLTIIGEFSAIIRFLKAIAQVTQGRRTSLITAGGGSIRIKAISTTRFWVMATTVAVPRLVIAAVLGCTGARFLLATINPSDILLNSMALAFVLEIDELLYVTLAPQRAACIVAHTEALPLPERRQGIMINHTVIKFATVAALLATFYVHGVKGIYSRMQQARDILCTGDRDFIFAVNPATGVVEAAPTTHGNGSALSPHGLTVLQLAKPLLVEQAHWSLDPAYLRASRSKASTAKLAFGIDHTRKELSMFFRNGTYETGLQNLQPDKHVFEVLMRMASATVGEDAEVRSCIDVRPTSYLRARMLELTDFHENCTGVGPFCDGLNATGVRSLCPVTCGCAAEVEPAAGFFASRFFGCPVACENALQAVMRGQMARGNAKPCGNYPPTSFETNPWLHSYLRGLFELIMGRANVVIGLRNFLLTDGNYFGVPENRSDDVFRSIMNGTMLEMTSAGRWDFAPGLPHPRGLKGCEFWTSWEVTVMLGIDLCGVNSFRSLRSVCPISCGCKGDMKECPLECLHLSGR